MTVGDGFSGLGATTHRWTPEVSRVVSATLREFPRLTANSYRCHPWCGWAMVSVDFWGPGGRGDAAPPDLIVTTRQFLMNLSWGPSIRHTILEHQLWTSWGGYSRWNRDDHSGRLRHLHVTYWPARG